MMQMPQKMETAGPVEQWTPADPMIAMIERVVLDPSASLDKLERMLAMRERIEAGSAKKAFDLAMAAAKAEIPPIIKNRTVDFTSAKGRTNYRHEDLAEIARTIDPILGAHGLSYRYRTAQEARTITVTCIVSHRDGHSEETTLQGAPDESGNKNAIQQVGSTITFLQRYTLKAALGLAAAHDDDGRAASAAPKGTINETQFRELRELMVQAEADEARFLAHFGAAIIQELPAARFTEAVMMLRRKIKDKSADKGANQ